MKYKVRLNNYQYGSYTYRQCKRFIIQEKRIDPHHVELILEIDNKSDYDHILYTFGGPEYSYRVKEIGE